MLPRFVEISKLPSFGQMPMPFGTAPDRYGKVSSQRRIVGETDAAVWGGRTFMMSVAR